MPPSNGESLRDPELGRAIAEGITFIRERAGHSRTTAAQVLGWERATLVEVEIGRRDMRLSDLETVCRELDAMPGEVLGRTARGHEATSALEVA